ncbi:rubrerythrin family protein [Selenomonadales bacterium OttesenSCG-928-I06]|nr:rubrerythrin family protein [Selenomonadales bacterium OttesenSCG-928-I06]
MEKFDAVKSLKDTLLQKQDLVRRYQSFAGSIDDAEVSKMYKHFAEAEALHASQIKEKLKNAR